MRSLILLCLVVVASPAYAGWLGPDVFPFVATVHPDGSRTWVYTLELKVIPRADMALPAEERDRKLAGVAIGWQKVCDQGWEITNSHTDKKHLIIEGRCL